MSRCAACVIERPDAVDMPLEQFHEALLACSDCPLLAASPSVRLLVKKHSEAARSMRKLRSEAGKLLRDNETLDQEVARYEDRVSRLDQLHQSSLRELEAQIELARRQEQTLRALSTPILRVSQGVVALPVIGRVDRARSDVIMTKLLAELADRHARHAILDLTGVEAIDLETAGHLLRIVAAARLLGAEVLLTGICGEVARTLVDLDFDPESVTTFSSVEEALRRCLSGPHG